MPYNEGSGRGLLGCMGIDNHPQHHTIVSRKHKTLS